MTLDRVTWKRPAAEFLAIFAGVTLSFAADDWRDRLADREAEQAGLELILDDLRADTVEILSAISFVSRHDEAALAFLSFGDEPPSADSIGTTLKRFIFGDAYQFQRAGFLSLREADRLSLIRDVTLRSDIIRYFEEEQVKLVRYLEEEQAKRDDILEALVDHVRWPGPRSMETTWPLAPGPVSIRTSWAEIRGDAELEFRAMFVGAYASLSVRLATEVLESNTQLRGAIERQLENG